MKRNRFFIKLILMMLIVFIMVPSSKVNGENKNNNPLLIDILINGKSIESQFDQFITDYVIAIEKEKIEIEAVPDDANAKVEIIGNTNLQIGKNEIEIKVIAEDGKTTQSYYLHITRGNEEKANANLKDIQIEGVTINPKFNSKDIEYYVEYKGMIEKLNINAIPENENAKVEIMGNESYNSTLHVGKIVVTAEDGITTKTYKIIAKREGESVEEPSGLEDVENEIIQLEENKKQEQQNNNDLIIGVVFVIIVILFSIFIIKSKKK